MVTGGMWIFPDNFLLFCLDGVVYECPWCFCKEHLLNIGLWKNLIFPTLHLEFQVFVFSELQDKDRQTSLPCDSISF